MNHVLLGISIPFAVLVVIYMARKCRATPSMLIAAPLLMGIMAIYAVVPDIPRALGMHELYMDLSRDKRCDIFLLHHSIDQVEVDSPLFLAGVVLVMMLMLFMAWREICLREMRANIEHRTSNTDHGRGNG